MKSITIIGRRWFNRSCGNTYNSATIITDDQTISVPFGYGYGSHYLDRAASALEVAGLLPGLQRLDKGGIETLWRYCERMGITYNTEVSDVKRKKDL
jgi:hypothetical protein